jgi:hypothetical protein
MLTINLVNLAVVHRGLEDFASVARVRVLHEQAWYPHCRAFIRIFRGFIPTYSAAAR